MDETTQAAPEAPKTSVPRIDPALVPRLLDRGLDLCRARMSASFLERSLALLSRVGHIGILAGAALGLLLALALAAKNDSFSVFLAGIAWVFVLFVLQYTASKMMRELDSLLRSSRCQMCSRGFVDCFALTAILAGVLILIGSLVTAVRVGDLAPLLAGAGAFIVIEYLAAVALNPESVSLSFTADATAGEEAIGLATFLLKAMLRLVPVLFATGIVVGVAQMLVDGIVLLRGGMAARTAYGMPGAADLILVAAALPLVSYLAFIVQYLALDLARAVLAIPGKLDSLRNR